jgi:hypothetical protein
MCEDYFRMKHNVWLKLGIFRCRRNARGQKPRTLVVRPCAGHPETVHELGEKARGQRDGCEFTKLGDVFYFGSEYSFNSGKLGLQIY